MTARAIYLHGAPAKIWGKDPIMVDADTTFLVVQGLISQLGQKFKETIRNGNWHILKGKPAELDDLGPEEVQFTIPNKVEELHFIPAIEGGGNWVRVIIGIVLIVVGVYCEQPWLVEIGIAMVLGGVAGMLAPKPKKNNTEQAGQNPSFMFNGTVNVTEQGGPVPIVYGRVPRAGSVVLSAGMTVEKI